METRSWSEYKCKSGQTLFVYNKVTGEHKWPAGFENGKEGRIIQGHPVIYKEFFTIATQTDDNGCNNGCMSMYINTDSKLVSNILTPLPTQLQPGDLDQVELHLNKEPSLGNSSCEKHGAGNNIDKLPEMFEVLKELKCPTENNLVEIGNDVDAAALNEVSKLGKGAGRRKACFRCSYCSRCYTAKSNFDRHFRTHTGEKPFKCPYCEKKFARKAYLAIHIRTHTGERPFQCSICKKKFAYKLILSQHLRTHTGERPFECSICKKRFKQQSHLYFHRRTHTGEKAFECSVCKKMFARRTALRHHLRTVHAKE